MAKSEKISPILKVTGVSEESLAQLKKTVNQFIASNDEVYTFKPDLTPDQCAAVHLLCRQRKITSKSEGLNERRCISIFKPKELKTPKGKNIKSKRTQNISSFTFAQNSKLLLQDLFTHYPPDSNDGDEHNIGDSNRIIKSVQVRKNDIFSKASASKSEIRSRVNVFDERLTELGEKLGSLPVHPLTSKMLLFAILLDCLDPALTLACLSVYRDPFTLPMSLKEKQKAAAARSELASMFLGHGDQLAVIAAFDCWKNARERGQEARFCSDYCVSSNTMHMISKMRKQLHSELVRNGFIPEEEGGCSSNARDPGIVHSVLVAGLYPSVGILLPPRKAGERADILTSGGNKVLLHNHSMNSRVSLEKPLAIYDEVIRVDGGLHIKNCCIVGPLPLLLLATEILVSPVSGGNKKSDGGARNKDDIDVDMKETNTSDINSGNKVMSSPNEKVEVTIDRWLHCESRALDVAQIYFLRERLSAAMLFKVKHPGKVLPDVLHGSMYSIACILSSDGMSGVPLPQFPPRTTSMVNKTEINQSDSGKEGRIGNPKLLISTTGHGNCEITDSQHQDEMQGPSKRPRLSFRPVDA